MFVDLPDFNFILSISLQLFFPFFFFFNHNTLTGNGYLFFSLFFPQQSKINPKG